METSVDFQQHSIEDTGRRKRKNEESWKRSCFLLLFYLLTSEFTILNFPT